MIVSSRRFPQRRALLLEARSMQRYVCGRAAPAIALRRHLRLLGDGAPPLPIPRRLWELPVLLSCLEPLPLLQASPAAREFQRRLYLVMLLTEATPWGAAQAPGGRHRIIALASLAAGVLAGGVIEAFALPIRLLVRATIWNSGRSYSGVVDCE